MYLAYALLIDAVYTFSEEFECAFLFAREYMDPRKEDESPFEQLVARKPFPVVLNLGLLEKQYAYLPNKVPRFCQFLIHTRLCQ